MLPLWQVLIFLRDYLLIVSRCQKRSFESRCFSTRAGQTRRSHLCVPRWFLWPPKSSSGSNVQATDQSPSFAGQLLRMLVLLGWGDGHFGRYFPPSFLYCVAFGVVYWVYQPSRLSLVDCPLPTRLPFLSVCLSVCPAFLHLSVSCACLTDWLSVCLPSCFFPSRHLCFKPEETCGPRQSRSLSLLITTKNGS